LVRITPRLSIIIPLPLTPFKPFFAMQSIFTSAARVSWLIASSDLVGAGEETGFTGLGTVGVGEDTIVEVEACFEEEIITLPDVVAGSCSVAGLLSSREMVSEGWDATVVGSGAGDGAKSIIRYPTAIRRAITPAANVFNDV
jgi:hypothetical protein